MKNKSKNIQVPERFLIDVLRLVSLLDDDYITDEVKNLKSGILIQVDAKIKSMEKRNLYTKFKTAETEEEKEEARKKYLELSDIKKDWQY